MIQNFKIVFFIMNKKGDGDRFLVKVKSLFYKQVMENNQIGISYLICECNLQKKLAFHVKFVPFSRVQFGNCCEINLFPDSE